MVEASPVKFYFAKYFFLAFSILQWLAAATIFFRHPFTAKTFFFALVFITIGMLAFFFFLLITEKVRRVAVGKNKIVVTEGDRNVRFAWPEVKSLTIVPFVNLYRLKLKGKKGCIYFFPSQNIDPAFGLLSKDTSKMGDIVQKRKKELGLK
ncbi:hypothetical protein [Chryseolinea lacunae]|uniref:PH domain-containing protein n=1 Tax=Chryseolinea lacunae TaxID=2801331 RepID=A0ABS1KS85_9BACT|nr:hypothetical protein [Chryseolinea lacunae]MBL0742330.1 hypothetical protein [Chryseolinea lacunae]